MLAGRRELLAGADPLSTGKAGRVPAARSRAHLQPGGRRPAADLGWQVEAAEIGRYACDEHAADDDFAQPRALYRDVMASTDKEHLVTTIVSHVRAGVKPEVMPRVIQYWTSVHPDLGALVAKQLNGS